jgi:hypothetical protein
MKNSARAQHNANRNEPKRGIAFEGQVPEEKSSRSTMGENGEEIVQVKRKKFVSKLSPVVQAKIVQYYLQGDSYLKIARKLHRDERAITNVCKALNIEAELEEQKRLLVGESWKWRESIMFAVENEGNADVAMRLAQAFGMVPTQAQKLEVTKPSDQDLLEQYKMRAAWQLGLCAMERASTFGCELPLTQEELDERVQESMEEETKHKTLAEEMKAREEERRNQ